jgi:hypothetical protein
MIQKPSAISGTLLAVFSVASFIVVVIAFLCGIASPDKFGA